MKIIILFSTLVLFITVKAWQDVRNPFEFLMPQQKIHTVSDCMHVTSEEGLYVFRKLSVLQTNLLSPLSTSEQQHHHHQQQQQHTSSDEKIFDDKLSATPEAMKPSMAVCGVYFVTDPDKIVEVTVKNMDVNCETGGLLAFVDGWELNGEYFPSKEDHHLTLNDRVDEFCNDHNQWPFQSYKKVYRSSQNAALLQYRIPISGSFMISVKYRRNPKPCHIMAEGVAPYYTLKNNGYQGNCTLTALFPAAISVIGLKVGETTKLNYDCDLPNLQDKLTVGGSTGLNSYDMEKSTVICGTSEKPGPEQAIFCGTTTVRLSSSGHVNNEVLVQIRPADENDLSIATLICPI